MGVLSNKIKKEELKVGNHIYSWRNAYIYSHHGIYVGEEKVIHFTPGAGQEIGTGAQFDRFIFSSFPRHPAGNPCPKCGDQYKFDGVMSSCIDCFLSGGKLYLFQYGVSRAFFLAQARGGTCTLATSDPPEDVIHRANFLLLNGFGIYNIFRNNCEDFAVYCKTSLLVSTSISVGRSGQAASFLAATSAVVSSPLLFLATSFSGLAVAGLGTYCVSRYLSDIGVRRDVAKVSVEMLEAGVIIQQVSNIASAVSVKLDGSNFSVWEPQIKSHLLLMDLMNVMDGTEACPNELLEADATGVRATNPEHKKWISANLFLKSLLIATISPLLVFEVSAYEKAAEIWNLFQKRYKPLNQSQISEISELRGKLEKCHLKQYSKVEEYLQAIKTISGQLTLVNEPLSNIELVLIIIRGLPSEYSSLKTNVRARATTIPIDELCSLILSEEIHIANEAKDSQQAQSTEPLSPYQTTHNSTHTGSPTQSSRGRRGYQNRRGRNGNFGNFGGRFNNFRGGYSGGRNFNTGGFNGGGRNRGRGGFPGGRSTGYNNNAQTWPPNLA